MERKVIKTNVYPIFVVMQAVSTFRRPATDMRQQASKVFDSVGAQAVVFRSSVVWLKDIEAADGACIGNGESATELAGLGEGFIDQQAHHPARLPRGTHPP